MNMVDRGMMAEVSCPRYVYRGTKPWMADCGCRGFIPRPAELTIIVRTSCSLCRGRNISPYPGWTWSGSPGYPGIAMPGYISQRFSLFLRLLRDWRSRSTCMGCPPHLPMTSGVNGYRSQPTGRGCACPVGVTVRDPAPPVMQDVGTLYPGIVLGVYTVPRHSVLAMSSTVLNSSPVWRGAI